MAARRNDHTRYEGHLQDRLYVGNTTFEHGIGKQAIFDRVNHLQCVAGTGAGKFIRHGAFVSAWGGPGGGLFVSPKSAEWADFGLARRADPALWARSQRPGKHLGIDPRKPTKQRLHQVRFHLRNGRCFLVAPVNHSAWPTSWYNPVADIDFQSDHALSRVLAVAGASFPPAPPSSNRDSWYWQSPTGALGSAWAFLNLTDPDPRHHTLAFALRWVMGYDENPERLLPFLPKGKDGKRLPPPPSGSPWMQKLHFQMMAQCKQGLSGRIALAGNALSQLGDKNFGTVVSELESKASWLLDPRYEKVVNAPRSDFRLAEIGADEDWPVTVYVSPVPAEGENGDAFLRMFYGLASLIFLQREFRPQRQILLVGDEIGSTWGRALRDQVLQNITLGRARSVCCLNYFQDSNQFEQVFGRQAQHTVAGNSAALMFGANDPTTKEFISSYLGSHTIRGGKGAKREVPLVSPDAVGRELAMTSPLAYYLSPAHRPIRVELPAYKRITTPEGATFPGMPGMDGHYEEFL